ncbi:hypothetical protein JOF56_010943 [Kibdelosporangium banguiense]|uniref:Small secreted protein n=1 Tax=Kibdelosporangium banguiense TaxID=1365924 RepID=A0ABS4U1N2_9PSEU|nr:hypothetical protein [Kibdelosporangium banguiense]MBP2330558.1 hypothetical protein [Kibdelosporangium banguiense]
MNRLAVVGTAVVVALTAGCGSSRDEPNEAAISWAEQICQTMESGGAKLSRLPQIDPANPRQATASLQAYLGSLADSIESVSIRLEQAGPPPVTDGQAAVDRARTTLGTIRTALGSARDKLQQMAAGDPESFRKGMQDVSTGLAPLGGAANPIADLRANKELDAAFAHAPACQRVPGRREG